MAMSPYAAFMTTLQRIWFEKEIEDVLLKITKYVLKKEKVPARAEILFLVTPGEYSFRPGSLFL